MLTASQKAAARRAARLGLPLSNEAAYFVELERRAQPKTLELARNTYAPRSINQFGKRITARTYTAS